MEGELLARAERLLVAERQTVDGVRVKRRRRRALNRSLVFFHLVADLACFFVVIERVVAFFALILVLVKRVVARSAKSAICELMLLSNSTACRKSAFQKNYLLIRNDLFV